MCFAKDEAMRETYRECVLAVISEILGVIFDNM